MHFCTVLNEDPRKGLQACKILWAKVQKQKSYWVIKFWTSVPIFSKLVNFGTHILALLESPQEGLQDAKCFWAKVQKQKSFERSNSDNDSDFLEIGELWSIYFDLFGKPREGLQAPKILSAKVQKQKSYWLIKFWTWSRFSRNWWTLVRICFGISGTTHKQTRSCQNFVYQQQSYVSKTQKFPIVGNFGGL